MNLYHLTPFDIISQAGMGEKVKVRTEKEKQLQEATKYFIEKNVRDIKQFQQGFFH